MTLKKFTKKQIYFALCLFMCCFSVSASEYQPFSETGSLQHELLTEPGVSDMNTPFESSGSAEQPALYGPGGDPIGGLPVGNANWLLLGMVCIHAGYKLIRIRRLAFNNKFKKPALFMLGGLLFVATPSHAQEFDQAREQKADSLIQYYMSIGLPKELAEKRTQTVMSQEMQTRIGTRGPSPAAGSIHIDREYQSYTADDYVRKILINTGGGSCATEGLISNVKLTGNAKTLTYFSNGEHTGLGMAEGLLLSTDSGLNAEGPNDSAGGLNGGLSGSDADLQTVLQSGQSVHTITILEFDFIPQQAKISFDYIFASEEYPEYVHANVNDAFGFFITDPQGNKKNIALLPNGTGVSINTVNNGHASSNTAASYPGTNPKNPAYYVPNYNSPKGLYMEYDGRTTMLTAQADVVPGQKYHMKLAIGNVGDAALGSGVFLRAGSFDMGLGVVNYGNDIKNMDHVFEGCTNNKFELAISPSSSTTTLQLNYSGPNVNNLKNLDGTPLPSTVTVPANSSTFNLPYQVVGPVASNGGDFTIAVSIPGCGDPWTKTVSVFSKLAATPVIKTPPCPGGSNGVVGFNITGGSPAAQMSLNGGSTWQRIKDISGLAAGTHTVLLRDSVSCNIETLQIKVEESEDPELTVSGTDVCANLPFTLTASAPSLTSPVFKWYTNSSKSQLLYTGNQYTIAGGLTANKSYYVEVTASGWNCSKGMAVNVLVTQPATAAIIQANDLSTCYGTDITLTSSAPSVSNPEFKWYESQTDVNPIHTGSELELTNITATKIYYVSVSGDGVCENQINNRKPVTVSVFGDIMAGTITGNPRICPGGDVSLTGPGSTGGSSTYTYQWQSSEDKTNWTDLSGETGLDLTYSGLAGLTYFRRITTDNCGTKISNEFSVNIAPEMAYWSKTPEDNNWNNPNNWTDENGNALNNVPSECTDIHIPGNASTYPDLDFATTPRSLYGNPVCNDITFHFGAEVAKQNHLTYNKAYIRYNFGYYQGNTNVYRTDGDPHSAEPMKRNRWYALATPLNKIVSGDFSVGGYPNIWQQGFKTTIGHSGQLVGDWYSPANTNVMDPGTQGHYGISVWAARMQPFTGENKHDNLNALKGILEMPYFEDQSVSDLHRVHSYENGISTFKYYYYDEPSLDFVPESVQPYSTIARGNEAYRFVTDDLSKWGAVNGESAFKMTVPAGAEIMIGNPFLSSLDFTAFKNANSGRLEQHYRLYETPWNTYAPGLTSASGLIPSFQAFFVKTQGTPGTTTELYFPVSASVARSGDFVLKSSETEENILYVEAHGTEETVSKAVILLNGNDAAENIPQLFIDAQNDTVAAKAPQLYIRAEDGSKNVLFNAGEAAGEKTMELGIESTSATEVTLKFKNVQNLLAGGLYLKDTRTGDIIDLTGMNSYTFRHDPQAPDRFLLSVTELRAPTGIEENKGTSNTIIRTEGQVLYVSSTESVSSIAVYTLQGTLVLKEENPDAEFTRKLNTPSGVYLVKINYSAGNTQTEKIIIK